MSSSMAGFDLMVLQLHVSWIIEVVIVQLYLVVRYRCQSGFKKGFCCSDAMHKIYSDCVNWKSQGNYVSIISLDFKEIFSCLDRNILVEMLRR